MRLLLWAVLIFAVVYILRSRKSPAATDSSSLPATREIEAMLGCAHCGTYIPASEALFDSANRAFCCDEHRRQHAARR